VVAEDDAKMIFDGGGIKVSLSKAVYALFDQTNEAD